MKVATTWQFIWFSLPVWLQCLFPLFSVVRWNYVFKLRCKDRNRTARSQIAPEPHATTFSRLPRGRLLLVASPLAPLWSLLPSALLHLSSSHGLTEAHCLHPAGTSDTSLCSLLCVLFPCSASEGCLFCLLALSPQLAPIPG